MRTESLNHKFVYGSQITIGRLVSDVADSTSKLPRNGYKHVHILDDTHIVSCFILCLHLCREAGMYSVVHSSSVRCGSPCRWCRRECPFLAADCSTVKVFSLLTFLRNVFSTNRKRVCICTKLAHRATTMSTRRSRLAHARSRLVPTSRSISKASRTVSGLLIPRRLLVKI